LRLQRSRASSSQLLSLIINTFYSNKVCASRLGGEEGGRKLGADRPSREVVEGTSERITQRR
jgi:hypothetical protein